MNTFYKIAEVIEYAEKNDDKYIVPFNITKNVGGGIHHMRI